MTILKDFDRTIMSAQLVMGGMFPPQGNQIWNTDLNWQPIPVHVIQTPQCDRYDAMLNEYMNSTEYKTKLSQKSTLIKYLEEHVGEAFDDLEKVLNFYDTLYVEQLQNKP